MKLVGYRFSVYTWAVRMALAEARQRYSYVEADPFDAATSRNLRCQHPFRRVPVLYDGAFRIYETGAILGYLLGQNADRTVAARARQVAGIVDSYAYWPLVRQVFSHSVFRPAQGQAADEGVVAQGLAAAPDVLSALDEIAAEGLVLGEGAPGTAECHLAPMLGYFTAAGAGRNLLARYTALSAWFERIERRESYQATRPPLAEIGAHG